jgi:4-amino-4-deoxy-L-arabinose transferase-like glycosyltransferase
VKLKAPEPGVVLFAAAFALRVAWVLSCWSRSGPALEFPDEALHWQLASNLVSDGTLVTDDGRFAARMPAYPLFLALFAWTGEAGILIARLTQALLGAATTWVGYSFVKRSIDRRAALIAGVLLCIDPYTVFFANLLLTEVLFIFFAVALTACALPLVCRSMKPPRTAALGIAVCGAAALMTRSSAAGWILLLWLVLWLLDSPRAHANRRLALYVVVLAICLFPWALRNRAVIGAPAWLSTNGGVTLFDAQGPQANGSSNQQFLTELPQLAGLDEVQRDRELRRLAIQQMRSDPARVLKLAAVKFVRTWRLTPNLSEYRGGVIALVSAAFTAATLVLAFVGLARALGTAPFQEGDAGERRPVARDTCRRLHLLLWLPVVYFTLVHCVFVGSLRYRVPLMPFIEIAAATAFVRMRAGEPAEL